MSKPKYKWYSNVVRAIRYYPTLKASKDATQLTSTTAGYSGMPHGSGTSRTTECAALRTLSPREEEELDAIELAVQQIGRKYDGQEILKIIEMVDWRKTHTVEGAGMVLFKDKNTTQRLRAKFVYAVAKNMRYL